MIAIEVPESNFVFRRLRSKLLPAERLANVLGTKVADVCFDRGVALARKPVTRAVRMKQVEHALVRPTERVDPERALPRREPESHRDEEAALERADFGDVARDAELALAADDVPADRSREARRHAAYGVVALGG